MSICTFWNLKKKFFRTVHRPWYLQIPSTNFCISLDRFTACLISVLLFKGGVWYAGSGIQSVVLLRAASVCQICNWEIQLEVSWCADPLSYFARQTSTFTDRQPRSPKQWIRDRQLALATRAKAAMLTLWIVPKRHFSTALNWRFSVFFPQL
jgi:hypothetical protein